MHRVMVKSINRRLNVKILLAHKNSAPDAKRCQQVGLTRSMSYRHISLAFLFVVLCFVALIRIFYIKRLTFQAIA